jgi:acyl carrier protein
MPNNYESEITQMVSEIIEVPVEKLKPDADFFTDLGVDSLKAIEIVAAFEKKYRQIIPEQDIPKIRTIKQILDYTKNLEKKSK